MVWDQPDHRMQFTKSLTDLGIVSVLCSQDNMHLKLMKHLGCSWGIRLGTRKEIKSDKTTAVEKPVFKGSC